MADTLQCSYLTNSLYEAEDFSESWAVSELINCILRNSIFLTDFSGKRSFPLLSHMNPVHDIPLYFSKVFFNIILLSILRSWTLSL